MRRSIQSLLLAAVPLYLNYQSVLLDSGGAPLPSGPHELTFRITDSQRHPLYEENQVIDSQNGVFTSLIGNGTTPGTSAPTAGLTPELFAPGEPRYLEVLLGGVAADDPLEIVSVPYALWSTRVAEGGVDAKAIASGAIGMTHFANGLIDDLATALLASTPFADFQKGLGAPGGAQQVGVNTTFIYSGATTVQGVLKDLDLAIKTREEKNVNKAGDVITGKLEFKSGDKPTTMIDAATGTFVTAGGKMSVNPNGLIYTAGDITSDGNMQVGGQLKVMGDIFSGGVLHTKGYEVNSDLVITKTISAAAVSTGTLAATTAVFNTITSGASTYSVDTAGKIITKGGLDIQAGGMALDGGLTVKTGNLDVKSGDITVSGKVDGVDVSAHAESTMAHANSVTAHGFASDVSSDLTGTLANPQIKPKTVGPNEVSDDITTKNNFYAMLKDPAINPPDTSVPLPEPKIVAWGIVNCTGVTNEGDAVDSPCPKPTGYNIDTAVLGYNDQIRVSFSNSVGNTYIVQGYPTIETAPTYIKFGGGKSFSFFVIANK